MAHAPRILLRKVASLLQAAGKPPSPPQDAEGNRQVDAKCTIRSSSSASGSALLTPTSCSRGPGRAALGAVKGDTEAIEFFFARVPPTVTYDELLQLFTGYGAVDHLNLFRPFAEAKTSKGCGIVRFQSSAAAAAAKAALHDTYKWAPDYAPMVLERVNEKKKRSNISSGGTNELIFTPKFLNSRKGAHEGPNTQQQQQQQPQGLSQGAGSCSSLLGPELQRHLSQSSAYSVASSAYSADGMPRYSSCGSLGTSLAASSRDSTVVSDRGMPQASGFMAPPSLEAVVSNGCNAIHSGSLLQAAAEAGGPVARQADGRPAHGMLPGRPCDQQQRHSFERPQQQQHQQRLQQDMLHHQQQLQREMHHQQQCMQQEMQQHFDLLQLYYSQQQQQHVPAAAPALDEGCASGGAYLPAFRPLPQPAAHAMLQAAGGHPAAAALAAAAACSAAQPTSLSILGGTPQPHHQQQQGLRVQLPFTGMGRSFNAAGMAGVPSCLPFDGTVHMPGSFAHAAAAAGFDGLTMAPSTAGFSNECFSTYSNFINGHPSAQHAQARSSNSCNLAGLSAASLAEAAAAADCSANLLASSASFAAQLQHQQQHQQHQQQLQPTLQHQQHQLLLQSQLQQQHLGPHQSGSNLQLTSGAMYGAAAGGGMWDNVDELSQLQQQNVLQLEDSGYFDLYKSGSSVDSLKGCDDTTTNGSSSCAANTNNANANNRMSSCSGSTDARAMQEQQCQQLQLAGGVGLPQMAQLSGAPTAAGPAGSFFARAAAAGGANNSLACGGDAQPWPLQDLPHDGGRLFASSSGAELPTGGAGHACNGGAAAAASKADDGFVTVELPASAQAVGAVAPHINSITDMTGAAVLIASAGQLSFKLIGTAGQVSMATSVIQLLLQKQQRTQG